ncbi:MAG TPA: prolyl oligopeptidase family serine peptidase [Wenzhouxiangella sp.]|nr:prolyl oligopeptidase family serine peptidase [Wenzhouxiangella sp.]
MHSSPIAGALILAVGFNAAVAAEPVERITEGNLVKENIPEIPTGVTERLRQFQNVRGHGFSDWTDEGILISTRFGEVSQIHHVKTPGGARRQVTFYDEPVSGADVNPAGGSFAFGKDTGGDEFFQGYLFDLANGNVTHFTEPGTRNGGLVWSDDGQQIAWYRSTAGDPNWDIMVGDPSDPTSVRLAHDGEGALFPVDWSADGSRLVVQQYISITRSRIFTLDLSDGGFSEFNPDESVAYSGAALLADGDILTVTDKGSEFPNLVRFDAETGDMTNFTADIDWGVAGWDLSADETTVVFTLNEGGLGTVKLLDLNTGELRDGPDLPIGIASGATFSPDGTKVGFTFNGATSPADAWSFDVETLALTRWTSAEVGGLNPENFVTPTLFDYPNDAGMDIPAFKYIPEGDGPHPVIIQIHGGPEAQSRPRFSSTYQYWASELGVAVLVPNVRGSAGYGKSYVSMDNGLNRKRSVEDIGALLDWVATQPNLDKNRVVVYGGSYGGYMVLASMIDYGDRLAGGVNIVGISDFTTFLKNTKGYRRDLRRAEYGDEREPEIAAFFEEISPLNNAAKIDKPLFIIQGYNDPRVPYTEAEQILEAVKDNGVEAWFLMAMDEGHGFRKKSNRDYQREAVTVFLQDVLALE